MQHGLADLATCRPLLRADIHASSRAARWGRRQLDLVVACRVLPLQALSLLLLPLPLTLPRLFGLLLANPVAIIEGEPTCACGPPTVDAAQVLANAGTPQREFEHSRDVLLQAGRLTRCWSARGSSRSHCTGRWCCPMWA